MPKPEFSSEFGAALASLVQAVSDYHGVQVRTGHGARSPWTQARLWRRSRTTAAVSAAAQALAARGAPFLSRVLLEVGPQATAPWATNALPGNSWHQLAEAQDFWVVGPGGNPDWDGGSRGYLALAEEAARLGLTSGWFWVHRDAGHVQLRREPGPDRVMPWPDLDDMVHSLWGDREQP